MERLVEVRNEIKDLLATLADRIRRRRPAQPEPETETHSALNIGRYSLVLMDGEGQVVWTRDWDAGGIFRFGPHYCLRVFCEFTNRSPHVVEVSEYEIELVDDAGRVVDRFGDSFGDSIVVMPGECKVFSGQWRL